MLYILILGIIIIACSSISELHGYIFFNYDAPDLQTPELQAGAREMVKQSLNKYDIWLSGFNWYIFFMPIISALPFALTYREDIKNNMIFNINTRIKHKKYIYSKIIINAVSGGCAVIIPMILSLIVSNIFFGGTMDDFSTYKAFGGIFNSIFKNNYYEYILIHLGIEFLFGCSYASIALAVSSKIKNSMAIILAPFLFWAGGSVIITLLNTPMDINQFYMCKNLAMKEILIHLVSVFIVSACIFFYYTRKEEIYEKRDIL